MAAEAKADRVLKAYFECALQGTGLQGFALLADYLVQWIFADGSDAKARVDSLDAVPASMLKEGRATPAAQILRDLGLKDSVVQLLATAKLSAPQSYKAPEDPTTGKGSYPSSPLPTTASGRTSPAAFSVLDDSSTGRETPVSMLMPTEETHVDVEEDESRLQVQRPAGPAPTARGPREAAVIASNKSVAEDGAEAEAEDAYNSVEFEDESLEESKSASGQ